MFEKMFKAAVYIFLFLLVVVTGFKVIVHLSDVLVKPVMVVLICAGIVVFLEFIAKNIWTNLSDDLSNLRHKFQR
jgi:hypothetical protein